MLRKLIVALCLSALLACPADARPRIPLLGSTKNFPALGAVLDENFATGQFFPGPLANDIVNTRASSAYQVNGAGIVVSVANNILRSSGSMVIEPAGTYGSWPSIPTTATNWGVFGATISYNSATAPDGTLTAAQILTSGTGSGSAFINGAVGGVTAVSANTVATLSFFIKPLTRTVGQIAYGTNSNTDGCQANFDTTTGLTSALTVFGTGACIGSSMNPVGNTGWWIVWITGKLSTSLTKTAAPSLGLLAGTTGQGMLLWGLNVAINDAIPPADPPSYFLTTAAQAVRSADAAVIQRTGIGTLVFTFDDGSTQTIFTNPTANIAIPTNLNRRIITRMTGFPAVAPLRQAVATTSIPDGTNGTNAQVGTRISYTTNVRCDSIQVILPNFFSNSGTETSSGGTLTATASVELNGSFFPFTFSGSASGSTAGNLLSSDELALPITASSGLFIRAHGISSNSTLGTMDNFLALNGSATQLGATVPDTTLGGVVTNTTNGIGWGPVAVACRHKSKSICLFGDSIGYGYGPQISPGGVLVPSLSGTLPLLNMSVPGNAASKFSTSNATQLQLAGLCTSAANENGINDLIAGNTAAQVLASRAAMAALIPIPIIPTTITPSGSSADNFATATNQTTAGYNPDRATINNAVRALPAFIDITSPLEDGLNSGLWKNVGDLSAAQATTQTASPYLGLHPTAFGYGLVTSSGNINPGLFQ